MRKIGDSRYTQVVVLDEADEKSKACHVYSIVNAAASAEPDANGDIITPNFNVQINFQRGPIKEAGVNGVHNEDLLVVVLDRLNGFQNSEYKCRENAIAITKIEEALLWLNQRTLKRQVRGVEGTHQV